MRPTSTLRSVLARAATPQSLPRCLPRRPPLVSSYQPRSRRAYANWQSRYTYAEAGRVLFKNHPFHMSMVTVLLLLGVSSIGFVGWYYKRYIIDHFAAYPEPVAAKLRRALHYSYQDVDVTRAIKYYRQAIEVADELGLDSLSDEMLGVKIQLAAFLESTHDYRRAIEVLELVRADCVAWIEARGDWPGHAPKRTRVLAKCVAMAVKLGELYANPYVKEKELAEECLIWAVETSLKERKRREEDGLKPGEGDWLTEEQMGAALEALGDHFERKDMHYLAAPLYLQAIGLCPSNNCHTVVLMNNLSISLAQQNTPPYPGAPQPSRPDLIKAGRSWARKALEMAAAIAPPARTAECDVACAVATHNLGELAEMEVDRAEAERRYQEARSLAQAIGFEDGVRNADKGLVRLRGGE
ncbi:MAG: hypothetical protein M1826_003686 [Phylliscum demangeonii]|nr:MAG: hypothetical protein M1826_003686 [Phylliscum demangeonii]